MSLNYNFIDTIKLLGISFKNNMFISIILSTIIFTIILIINKDRLFVKNVIIILNILLMTLISYYYINDILTFKFSNPINNIYFYFLNSIIYLIVCTIITFKGKYKNINTMFYSISLINLFYSLFITYYLKNNTLIVIGNIFPIIKFGNIIYVVYYVLIVLNIIRSRFLTKKI